MKHFHSQFLERLSVKVIDFTSGSLGFALALAIVVGWLLLGPISHFSEEWQLFINSFTTTVTFLMVFLIQRAEKKDAQALHIKLNEVLRKLNADERLLDAETLPETKLDRIEESAHESAREARQGSERKLSTTDGRQE